MLLIVFCFSATANKPLTKKAAAAAAALANANLIGQDNGHNTDSENKEDSSSSDQVR